jgi:hypothetical protein
MARELYDQMLAGDGPLKALVEAASELRTWREGSLAEQEFQDGLHVYGDGMAEAGQGESWSMAARDGRRALPAEYGGGGRVVMVARAANGSLYMELVEGDTLLVGGVWLTHGARIPIDEVPTLISGVDADGAPIELR